MPVNLLKRFRNILSLVIILSLFGVVLFLFFPRQEVSATGGAFRYSKHGGGTVDDVGCPPRCGVDRAINPEIGNYYYDSPDAGQYQPGECNHCHELHASFGGSEPLPNSGGDAGPDPYLLMRKYGTSENYSNLCWYCHDNIMGGGGPGTGFWGFYQGGGWAGSPYQNSSHYNSSNFYWPGTTEISPVPNIWPRQNRSSLPSGNKGSCLNCHTPHGIKVSDANTAFDTTSPVDESGGVLAANQVKCTSLNPDTPVGCNRSVSTDYLIPRQLIAWEETLCERCHDSTGPAGLGTGLNNMNIKDEINKRNTGGSGHPVDDTSLAGRHVVSEALPITIKHVECYDCHNPHAVKPTNRVEGMKYIDISGTVRNPAQGDRQPYIYEVCFKCHGDTYNQVFANDTPFPDVATNRSSGGGSWPAYPKHFSNKRKEFNPSSSQPLNYPDFPIGYNTAFHPVASPGRNGTKNLCYQLAAAFGISDTTCSTDAGASSALSNLTIMCTDCHNNDQTATMRGPATYSYSGASRRSTDKIPSIVSSNNDFGTAPIGPHGSARNRILRGNYYTTNSDTGNFGSTTYFDNRMDPDTGYTRPKFELCFLCHEEARLIGNYGGTAATYTNFGSGGSGNASWDWNQNLHRYHLNTGAVCHDCHHNVHSNVEAQNTIYGDGMGGELPPDSHDNITDGKIDTHLLNFGPEHSGATSSKPRWYWDGSYFRCNMVCHSRSMAACAYTHGTGDWFDDLAWCS